MEWSGAKAKRRYGQVRVGAKLIAVHRLLWRLLNGVIPDGHEVCHRCDNPPCINPQHLFVGTHGDNMVDMARKNRGSTVRLEDVPIIRERAATERYADIARDYGITESTVGQIRRRSSWRHTGDSTPVASKLRKLTPADIVTIRESPEPRRVIAERLCVSESTIKQVRCGLTWRHVT